MSSSLSTPAAKLGVYTLGERSEVDALTHHRNRGNWVTSPGPSNDLNMGITTDDWAHNAYYVAEEFNPYDFRYIRIWPSPQASIWDEPGRWVTTPDITRKGVRVPYKTSFKGGGGTDKGLMIFDEEGVWTILNLRPVNLGDWQLAFRSNFQANWHDYVCDRLTYQPYSFLDDVVHTEPISRREGVLRPASLAPEGMFDPAVSQLTRAAIPMILANVQYGAGARVVLPTTKVEHKNASSFGQNWRLIPEGNDVRCVPHGTRFVWNIPRGSAEFKAYLESFPEAARPAVLAFVDLLEIYGAYVVGTGTGNAQMEASYGNPKEVARWKQLGLEKKDLARLPHGLIRPEWIRVVHPAP